MTSFSMKSLFPGVEFRQAWFALLPLGGAESHRDNIVTLISRVEASSASLNLMYCLYPFKLGS